MSKINDGGLAFPGIRLQQVGYMSDHTGDPSDDEPTYADVPHPGMTLRDWFAGQALSGMLAHSTRYRPRDGAPANWHEAIAQEAYEIADAMIASREVAK